MPAWIFGSPLGGFTRFILCILFGLATVVTLLLAARIPDRAEKSAAREVDSDEVEKVEADGDHASAWLGMIVHALLSWKARIGRMIRGDVRARTPMPVAQSPRHEPRFDGEDSEYEDGEEDDEEAPAPRRRAAARAPSRRGTNGYTLPSLNLLAAQRASERTTLSRDIIDGNAAALEGVLDDFGVKGEIINVRPGPVVTLYELEPGARHQIVARHRPCRRYCAVDVGDLGPRRRGAGTQRDRHRTAQPPSAKPSTSENCSPARISRRSKSTELMPISAGQDDRRRDR